MALKLIVTCMFVLALSLVFGATDAFAGQYRCSEKLGDGRRIDVAVDFATPSGSKAPVYRSRISLEGTEVPQLGLACFTSERPSTRYIKCAHQAGRVRIEIYPLVETVSGALKTMQYVIWNGSRASIGALASCH